MTPKIHPPPKMFRFTTTGTCRPSARPGFTLLLVLLGACEVEKSPATDSPAAGSEGAEGSADDSASGEGGGGGAEGDDAGGSEGASGDSGGGTVDDTGPRLPVDTGPPVDLTQIADNDAAWVASTTHTFVEGSAVLSDDLDLTGGLTYTYGRDGSTYCDMDVLWDGTWAGTDASGTCDGCDYTFQIDATIAADRSDPRCDPINSWTLLSDGYYINQHVGYADRLTLYTYTGDGWEWYYQNLLTGVGVLEGPEGDYRPGPYWSVAMWDGPYSSLGEVSLDGDTLRWAVEFDVVGYAASHYNFCYTAELSDATGFYPGTKVSGEVDCGAPVYTDGWAFDAAAGQEISVSVDAPTTEDGFTPYFFVNRPDGCAAIKAQQNFVCSNLPDVEGLYESCASARFTADLDGTYEVWVFSTGVGCGRGTVLYDLYVDVD